MQLRISSCCSRPSLNMLVSFYVLQHGSLFSWRCCCCDRSSRRPPPPPPSHSTRWAPAWRVTQSRTSSPGDSVAPLKSSVMQRVHAHVFRQEIKTKRENTMCEKSAVNSPIAFHTAFPVFSGCLNTRVSVEWSSGSKKKKNILWPCLQYFYILQ